MKGFTDENNHLQLQLESNWKPVQFTQQRINMENMGHLELHVVSHSGPIVVSGWSLIQSHWKQIAVIQMDCDWDMNKYVQGVQVARWQSEIVLLQIRPDANYLHLLFCIIIWKLCLFPNKFELIHSDFENMLLLSVITVKIIVATKGRLRQNFLWGLDSIF